MPRARGVTKCSKGSPDIAICWQLFMLFEVLVALVACMALEGSAEDARGWDVKKSRPNSDSEIFLRMLRTDYKVRIQPDYVHYTIDLLVQPCRDTVQAGVYASECCMDTGRAACQHHPRVTAGLDLQIAYFQNAHIPTCSGTVFEGDPNCGTYIEIHRPNDHEILGVVQIDGKGLSNGYRTTRVPTHRLCSGSYELWWVVRTRSGPYVQKTRDFYVVYPSCPAPEGAIEAPGFAQSRGQMP
mmetsp:Transcript_109231/g.308095  ORF Transcript_109231/g.308095 Transcript_109231/m.308095 type:complete len:241 (-) Transcript_109231:156-878(-)